MRSGIAVQLRENGRPPQPGAGSGASQRDGFAPGIGVTLVQQLRNRDFGKIRVPEELGAIEKCPLISFGGEMNALGRTLTLLAEIVSLEDIEALDQGDASGRRRWSADDLVAAIGAANRLPLLHFVLGKVLGG